METNEKVMNMNNANVKSAQDNVVLEAPTVETQESSATVEKPCSSKMSKGEKTGLIVGGTIFVAVATWLGWTWYNKRKAAKEEIIIAEEIVDDTKPETKPADKK